MFYLEGVHHYPLWNLAKTIEELFSPLLRHVGHH